MTIQDAPDERMYRKIFDARLGVLQQNLEHAMLLPAKLEEFPVKLQNLENIRMEQELWSSVYLPIRRRIDLLKRRIEPLRINDNLTEAWQQYEAIYAETQELYAECLVLIGGLALRDKGLENGICAIADELIRQCASFVGKGKSLTVPASREALTLTLGRIIHLRFPEWTIWTLPLTIHEYGHVLLDEFDSTLRRQFGRWPTEPLQAFIDQEIEQGFDQARARHRLNVLLADAFATYTLGPAYALSLVALRFNPLHAGEDHGLYPADSKRACVVIEMLRQVNRQNSYGGFYGVINELSKGWNESVTNQDDQQAMTPADEKRYQQLARVTWDVFDSFWGPPIEYPVTGDYDGYTVASSWAQQWEAHLLNPKEPDLPKPVSRISKLRDVLNAAWLCQLAQPARTAEVADLAQKLCQIIMLEAEKPEAAPMGAAAPRQEQPESAGRAAYTQPYSSSIVGVQTPGRAQ